MPNPPKPIEQKRRTGNPGKRKLPDGGSLALVGPIQAEAWQLDPMDALERVLGSGASWIGETDAPTVSLLRRALENAERAWQSGSIRDVIEAQKHAASLMSQLGFDPTARARLGLAEVKAASTLEKLRSAQKK